MNANTSVPVHSPAPVQPPPLLAVLLLLVLVALALDEVPADSSALLLRRAALVAASLRGGAKDAVDPEASAAAENVALWLQPGPALPPSAAIGHGDCDAGGIDCCNAPVAVRLKGGLGNNLFVAAFGIGLAMRRAGTSAGVALLRADGRDPRGQQARMYESTIFARFRVFDNPDEWLQSLKNERDVGSLQVLDTSNGRPFCSEVDAAQADQWAKAQCATPQLAEWGYFQDSALFRNISEQLRHTFSVPHEFAQNFRARYPPPDRRFRKNGSKQNAAAGGAIPDTSAGPPGGVPWAIHVRRGDYVVHADLHHLLPMTYFAEGIARMLEHLAAADAAGGPIFVFSDDIQWVREQEPFRSLVEAIFVDEPDPLISFYLLTLTAEGGVLCSNSTFCWWAAFLSEHRRRRVVRRLALFPDGWLSTHSLTGFHGPGDCGKALRMPYMTVLLSLIHI